MKNIITGNTLDIISNKVEPDNYMSVVNAIKNYINIIRKSSQSYERELIGIST